MKIKIRYSETTFSVFFFKLLISIFEPLIEYTGEIHRNMFY